MARCLLALFCTALLFVGGSRLSQAEIFSVGMPEFDTRRNFLDSPGILPSFIRGAVTSTLLSPGSRAVRSGLGQQAMVVSDSYTTSADYTRWSIRIRGSARFSDGSQVRPEDARFSLERCKKQGTLSLVSELIEHSDGVV
ncbi:MAG: hypothetical protein EBZ48_17495, partial [Proteobacteria bacterium]|nr:hypothetical protein [Pseudomonadota bacterium]